MIDEKQCLNCYNVAVGECPVEKAIGEADSYGSSECSCSLDAAWEVAGHLVSGDICLVREAMIAGGVLNAVSFETEKRLVTDKSLKNYWKGGETPVTEAKWAGPTRTHDGKMIPK